jgi:hypothetical protein
MLSACNDDSDFENSIQPSSDTIVVKGDTFHLACNYFEVSDIKLNKQHSTQMLLGEYYDKIFGNTKGEILAEFNSPAITALPDYDTTAFYLFVNYSDYMATGDSTVHIKMYQLSSKLDAAANSTAVNPDIYCDRSMLLCDTVFKPVYDSASKSGTIIVNLPEKLKNDLLSDLKNQLASGNTATIRDFFKGIYFSVESGANAMLTVSGMGMNLSCRYKNEGGSLLWREFVFPASKEVRQTNSIKHDYSAAEFGKRADSLVYAFAPAGLYTKIEIPLTGIKKKFGISNQNGVAYVDNNRKLSINSSTLKIMVADSSSLSVPSCLMLVKESEKDKFFSQLGIPNGTTAMAALYDAKAKAYIFELNAYLQNELRNENAVDNDPLLLIPVWVDITNNYITNSRYETKLRGVTLWNGKNEKYPMKLDIMVSGF